MPGRDGLTVCMVIATYAPEVSGGSLQGRTLAVALKPTVRCVVVTTTTDRALRREDVIDGVPVYRVYVNPRSPASKMTAAVRMARRLMALREEIDIIHLHGFSQKNWLVVLLNAWLRKPLVQKLTLMGTDDPASPGAGLDGRMRRWCYARADRLVAVSPALMEAVGSYGALRERVRLIANGVDVRRFAPPGAEERAELRSRLGLPPDAQLIVYVGMFARRKDPLTLWRAWRQLRATWGDRLRLLFIGATRSSYYEIDEALVAEIREDIRHAGYADHVQFVERTAEVEQYLRAADLFVHPSRQEGLPNAVLEAMATGVPCVVARLAGITDWIITDGKDGLLVDPGDVEALAQAMRRVLEDHEYAAALGRAARRTVEQRFGMAAIARAYAELYHELHHGVTPAGHATSVP